MAAGLPPNYFITSMQFTKHVYRDQYPSIDPTSPALSLAGKVVIITGASKGIGADGLAPAFARAGAKAVVLVARNAAQLEVTAKILHEIKPEVQTLVVPTDISDQKAVDALYSKVSAEFGHADILINNAASNAVEASLKDVDPAAWWEVFAINTGGTVRMTCGFLKALPSTSHGTVITMTSGAAYMTFPGASAYSLGKLVNLQMAAFVAAENANVTSIALHPGLIQTEMMNDFFKQFWHDTPELVGGTAVALCTEKRRALNGKFVAANWSIDDLNERAEEIKAGNLLEVSLTGTFGEEQFK